MMLVCINILSPKFYSSQFIDFSFTRLSQVGHLPGAYPGFCSMQRVGVFLLLPGLNASPLQGYPQN